MRLPVIGITANIIVTEGGVLPGTEKAALNSDYVSVVEQCGGLPVILPLVEGTDNIARQLELIDGLLLAGGYDIWPVLHKEEPAERIGYLRPELDKYEISLAKMAWAQNKPILGICRGIQVINVAFGGTLYQDLSYRPATFVKHMQQAAKDTAYHSVDTAPGTKLAAMLGESIITNSFHHQAVKHVAPGFIASAATKDGVVEAIENKGELFVVGVQWHPEMMVRKYPAMKALFSSFINEAIWRENCR